MMKNEILKIKMGKFFHLFTFVLLVSVFVYSCNDSGTGKTSAKASSSDTAIISFSEYEHDFGIITEGEKVSTTFTFENKGKGPVVISSVTTSCGCTVPKYETKPVAAGSKGSLEVVFDSDGKNGRQTKTITVHSNASKPTVLLRITGEVITDNKQ